MFVVALPISRLAFRPSFPSSGACDPKPFLLPELQSRAWLGLILCPAPGPHCFLGPSPTAITARFSREEWGCRILEAGQLVPGFRC